MREIRPYGSVRGVRRKPYPYRDHINPMRSGVPLTIMGRKAICDENTTTCVLLTPVGRVLRDLRKADRAKQADPSQDTQVFVLDARSYESCVQLSASLCLQGLELETSAYLI